MLYELTELGQIRSNWHVEDAQESEVLATLSCIRVLYVL